MTLFEGEPTFLSIAAYITLVSVMLAVGLSGLRVFRGPSVTDRVVGLDIIGLLSVSFIAVVAIVTEQPVMLDAAIALALISFLATVAFARFIEQRTTRGE